MESVSGSAKRNRSRSTDFLRELVPTTPNLYIDDYTNSLGSRWLHDVPLTEFGIPDRKELIRFAIGATGCRTVWHGQLDNHHTAWPGIDYRTMVGKNATSAAITYREMGALKIRSPRQLHDVFHAAFAQPPMPSEDIMAAFVDEDARILKLQYALLIDVDERTGKFIDPNRERIRQIKFLDELAGTKPSEVGHLPCLNFLASLDTAEARIVLSKKRSILRYDGGILS